MKKLVTVAAAFAAAFAINVGTAEAAPCDGIGMSKVFAPWGDEAFYGMADNGDFEAGTTGWRLSGNAGLVRGGNTHRASSTPAALQLPPGSSATSPPICVTQGNPTARMFANTVVPNASIDATLQIDIIYLDATRGSQAVKALGKLPTVKGWNPTRKFSLAQGQLDVKPDSGGKVWIQYRFTPLEKTTWLIDDLFVDPRMRN